MFKIKIGPPQEGGSQRVIIQSSVEFSVDSQFNLLQSDPAADGHGHVLEALTVTLVRNLEIIPENKKT